MLLNEIAQSEKVQSIALEQKTVSSTTALRKTSDLVSLENVAREGSSGLVGATFNFVNSIVGAGIVGIPFAINRSGFFMGILLLFLVAYLVDYGVRLLVKCGKMTGTYTYEDLMEFAYGRRGFYAVSIFMFIFAYGGMVAYIIIIGDTIPKIAMQAGFTFLEDRNVVIVVFSCVFIFPLCVLRDMSSLAWSSCISVIADVVLIGIVVALAPNAAKMQGLHDTQELYSFVKHTVFAGIGSMSFAFTCHHSSFFVHSSMKNPTLKRWNMVTHSSIFISLLAALVLGVSGYVHFGTHVRGDVLNNFSDTDETINLARALLAATMVFTYPMEQYVARHSIYSIVCAVRNSAEKETRMSTKVHMSYTLLLWGSSVFLGLCFTDVGMVLELTGAIAASMLGYIFPGLLYLSVHKKDWLVVQQSWQKESEEFESSISIRVSKATKFILPVLMILFGSILLVVGTLSAFL